MDKRVKIDQNLFCDRDMFDFKRNFPKPAYTGALVHLMTGSEVTRPSATKKGLDRYWNKDGIDTWYQNNIKFWISPQKVFHVPVRQ